MIHNVYKYKSLFQYRDKMKKFVPYLIALRPIGWIPFWFSLILGMIDGGFSSILLVGTGLIVFGPLILGSIYIINFYSDAKCDSESKVSKDIKMSQQPFASGSISPKIGLLYAIMLMVIGLLLAIKINVVFFVVSLYTWIILTIYSLPPIRLKERVFGDIFANSTTAGAASYIAGYTLFRDVTTISIYPIIWLTLLVASTYLLTVLIDFEDDKKSGLKTTAIVLGVKKAVNISIIIYFISFIFYILTLTVQWRTLAYWIIFLPILKSPISYIKLYRDNTRIYHLAKRGVQWAIFGVFGILIIYIILLVLKIPDTYIIDLVIKSIEKLLQ